MARIKLSNKIIIAVLLTAVAIFATNRLQAAWADLQSAVGGDNTATSATTPEINAINQDIENKKLSIEQLKLKQQQFQEAIAAKQAERADLENQLAIFDNRIAAAQANIDDVRLNIEKTQLEIKKVDLEIELKLKEIDRQKEEIGGVLGVLYQEGDKSDLEILLLNDNLTDYIDQLEHIRDINSGLKDKLDALKGLRSELDQDREQLSVKNLSLESLIKDLEAKMDDLTGERNAKQIVLSETRSSENSYQRLLNEARKQQQAAAWDIANLEKQMRMKMAQDDKYNTLSLNGFAWPVTKNTVTAYFHDPDYPYRNIMEHPAVDIRAAQGSPVKAAASGYVARAKPGPNGSYAYVMVVHADGLSTVYGHVSQIMVNEEDYVSQGQTIALSGGKPGTPGAGPMTTGAHLHFEVRLNGIPVNPLEYLP